MPIKTYWWRGGGGQGNYGDKLGPAIIQALSGQQVQFCSIEDADILAIGSVLETWFWPHDSWSHYSGFIWGVGRMLGKHPIQFRNARFAAVRGHLTEHSLSSSIITPVAVGDPGLLCPALHHPVRAPRFKLGVWPHWSELHNPHFRRLIESSPDICLIDPCGDIRSTLDQVVSCEAIASSSLHGLITADAFQIPNCWIRLNSGNEDTAGMPLFKYLDYYSGYSTSAPVPSSLTAETKLDSILMKASLSHHSSVSGLQETLLRVFPFRRT